MCLVVRSQAFSAMEQLRTHCAAEISTLEKSVGSQQELLTALNQTYPEQVHRSIKVKDSALQSFINLSISFSLLMQVGLNKACDETLSSASKLLSQTMDDHYSLMTEVCLLF